MMKTKGKETVYSGRTGEAGGAAMHCPVETTINLIGGKYKSLILWKLMGGTLRFSQLRKEVLCATPKMLTQQLRELESDGLIDRTVFPEVPPRVEYALTDTGKSIAPILEAIYSWGTRYLNERGFDVNCSMEPFSIQPAYGGAACRRGVLGN